MKVLGIVPARAGSKRIPGKNTRLLASKPLVAWQIENGLAARRIDRLVVSSDAPEVLEIARGYDPELPLERPAELATDTSPAIDYVRHALQTLEARGEGPFDVIAILQPTSPLTRPEDVDGTIDLLLETGADTAVSVVRVEHAIHPLKLKVMEKDRLLPYLEEEEGRMAAHELPDVYVRNCSVYATRRGVVEAGTIIGPDCRGYVMPRERSVDINDEVDWALAEVLLGRGHPPSSRTTKSRDH